MTLELGHASIVPVLERARLVISCGPGGVGKTTTSAALALHAAELGMRSLVMTIDPAKRLATCLNLEALGSTPEKVDRPGRPGEMWAMMLDTRGTFDDLVNRLSPDRETAQRIQASRLYSIFAGTMHGTTEYMALERLYDAYTSDAYDLVILDTPPLTNALEFFRVPKRASWFFDPRVMRWFLPRKKSTSRLRNLIAPGAVVMRLLKALAGHSLVSDITEFFEALELLSAALKERGDAVDALLRADDTEYVIITGAARRRVNEALYLDRQLHDLGKPADIFIINRSHHHFDQPLDSEALFDTLSGTELAESVGLQPIAAGVSALFEQLAASGHRHRHNLAYLADRVGGHRVCAVPDFSEDVHDMAQLLRLGQEFG